MFKKNTWIVGLLAVLAILFVGCLPQPEVEDTSGMEEFVIVDLSRAIAGKSGEVGANIDEITNGQEGFFTKAGDNTKFNIGADGLSVDPSAYSWGAGLDLSNPGIKFREGDKIYIKGKAIESGQVLLNTNHAGWGPLESWNPAMAAGEEFEHTFTLTAADVTAIKGTSPMAIRIRRNEPGTGKFLLIQVTVTGLREKDFVVGPGGYSSAGPKPICRCTDPNCPCKANPTKDCGEQILDSGIFECEFCRPKDATSFTPGAGTYTPAADGSDYFYVDLGAINAGSGGKVINIDVAYTDTTNVKKEATKVTYYFEANNQPLALTLTNTQKAAVLEALKAGLYVDVEIVAKATPRMIMRFGFCDPTTGASWNSVNLVTKLINVNDTTATKITGRLTPNAGNISAAAPKTADAFIIQQREARKSALEITSIKIIMPATQVINITELPITAPKAGETPDTTFNTSQFTGAITWTPALTGDGFFDVNKAYTANVTLTAKKYYTFKGAPGIYSVGDIKGMVSTWGTDVTNLKPVIDFVFPATILANNFPADSSIKPQSGSPLADLASDKVAFGKTLTATYAKGTGGTAVEPANVTFIWQKESSGAYTTVATGSTYTPTALGLYKVAVTADNYIPKLSDPFTVYSEAATGSMDTALNNTFTAAAGATKFWSFADWVGVNSDWTNGSSPLAISNGGGTITGEKVGNGLNLTNRNRDGACALIITQATQRYGNDGFSTPTFNNNNPWDPVNKKYKITVLGYIIDSVPAGGVKMVLQKDSDGYGYLSDQVAVTTPDGAFKLVYDVASDFNVAANIRITASSGGNVSYRITKIEVEDLGAR